jgi:CDP-diglyceride synthetase
LDRATKHKKVYKMQFVTMTHRRPAVDNVRRNHILVTTAWQTFKIYSYNLCAGRALRAFWFDLTALVCCGRFCSCGSRQRIGLYARSVYSVQVDSWITLIFMVGNARWGWTYYISCRSFELTVLMYYVTAISPSLQSADFVQCHSVFYYHHCYSYHQQHQLLKSNLLMSSEW